MNPGGLYPESPNTIALIGNHLPRRCGIATFTTDLLEALSIEAPETDCWAVVMNDVPEGYFYPSQVCFELNHKDLADYRLAADFLNMNQVDAVCVQHEFGIFGGSHGSHILELLHTLRMPVVTALHTVFREPDPGQKAVLEKLGRVSDRLVVMSHRAEEILKEVYGIPPEKIAFAHHGIPDVPFVDPNYYKDQFGVEGRKVILTFGLLSADKGIEHMIDALPQIVSKHPETAYIVLGATHPNVKSEEGAGKAVISTPYWYAEEMLSDGRGRIVPFQDSNTLAAEVNDLLDNEVGRHAMRKRAYTFSRNMIWKEVARRYLELFIEVKNEREQRPRAAFHAKTLEAIPPELPQLNLEYLSLLTDDVGILQHAKFIVPDRCHGYCTDDNARALIVVMMAQDLLPEDNELMGLACLYLSFLHHSFNEDNGRFRNFMGYDRRWLEEEGTEDCHGRAIWGLGLTVAMSKSESLTAAALNLFKRVLSVMIEFQSPRAWAFGLVGIHAYLRRFGGDSEVRRVRETLAHRLFELYRCNVSDGWPWIEETVTYASGKIPQALLLSGRWLHQGDMIEAGLHCLEWLVRIQADPKGHFVPIGNHGWFARNGQRARFDQQPIEAQNMIEACVDAYKITRDEKWIVEARRCFDWFLGRNDRNILLYDYRTGGCCDGLTSDGANQNKGAESTLAWLLSLLNLYFLSAPEEAIGDSAIAWKRDLDSKGQHV